MEFYQDNLNLESVGSGTGHTRKPLQCMVEQHFEIVLWRSGWLPGRRVLSRQRTRFCANSCGPGQTVTRPTRPKHGQRTRLNTAFCRNSQHTARTQIRRTANKKAKPSLTLDWVMIPRHS